MADKTNLERLIDAHVVASEDDVSPEHRKELNENFTKEEIDAIIKLKERIIQRPLGSDPSKTGGGML